MSSTMTARLNDNDIMQQQANYNQQQMNLNASGGQDNATLDSDDAGQLTFAGAKQRAQQFLDSGLPQTVDAALHQIKDKTSIGREAIAVSLAVLLSVFLVFAPGAALLSSLIGSVYQCYASVKVSLAADSASSRQDSVHWLAYWNVFALFAVLDFPLSNVIGYHLVKTLALLYLSVSSTGATRTLHNRVFAPIAHQISNLSHGSSQGADAADANNADANNAYASQQ